MPQHRLPAQAEEQVGVEVQRARRQAGHQQAPGVGQARVALLEHRVPAGQVDGEVDAGPDTAVRP